MIFLVNEPTIKTNQYKFSFSTIYYQPIKIECDDYVGRLVEFRGLKYWPR